MPSQFGEDKWIETNLNLPERGFYIDVGCAFPDSCSNTQFLRAKGWRGFGVDANPFYAQFWPSHFVVGIVSTEAVVNMDFREMPTHSRVGDKGGLFATTTLERLCLGIGVGTVDFLSLDVEGHEYEALRTLDLDLHKPQVIISEFMTDGIEREDWRVRDYLTTCGYQLAHQTAVNVIMVRI